MKEQLLQSDREAHQGRVKELLAQLKDAQTEAEQQRGEANRGNELLRQCEAELAQAREERKITQVRFLFLDCLLVMKD